jgi:hypothetical protein
MEKTVSRISGLGDCGLEKVASEFKVFTKRMEVRFKRLRRIRWMARITMLVSAVLFGYEIFLHTGSLYQLSLDMESWNELVEFIANSMQIGFCILPVLLGLVFIERLIERGMLLHILGSLERMNDTVYDEQFDDNPYRTQGGNEARSLEWLLEYLDCCTGLLLLIRMLAHQVSAQSSDKVVLDRCGIVRRGAGDNHTRILQKITILKLNTGHTTSGGESVAGECSIRI